MYKTDRIQYRLNTADLLKTSLMHSAMLNFNTLNCRITLC